MAISWSKELDTGLEEIDIQHRRIVEYINTIEVAKTEQDHDAVGRVLNDLLDYTRAHFVYEEELLQAAGYAFITPHQRMHQHFSHRISQYLERHRLGENVGDEIHRMLCTWLVTHIKRDDADYVASVREHLQHRKNDNQ